MLKKDILVISHENHKFRYKNTATALEIKNDILTEKISSGFTIIVIVYLSSNNVYNNGILMLGIGDRCLKGLRQNFCSDAL